MRGQLPPGAPGELLCDGLGGSPRADAAELAAWRDWIGSRLSPKRILGEGLMAAAAWQCVAACDAVADRRFAAANVSLVGSNQQAIGARFVAGRSRTSAFVRGRASRQHPTMNSRVILITGANGGLGQAIARAFLQESPSNQLWLAVHARREHAGQLAQEHPDRCRLRLAGRHPARVLEAGSRRDPGAPRPPGCAGQ